MFVYSNFKQHKQIRISSINEHFTIWDIKKMANCDSVLQLTLIIVKYVSGSFQVPTQLTHSTQSPIKRFFKLDPFETNHNPIQPISKQVVVSVYNNTN